MAHRERPDPLPLRVVEDVVDGEDLDEASQAGADVLELRPGVLLACPHAEFPWPRCPAAAAAPTHLARRPRRASHGSFGLVAGPHSNTATIAPSACVLDGAPANNSATDSDTLVPAADLSLSVGATCALVVTLPSVPGSALGVLAAESPAPGNNADSESTLVKLVNGDLQNDLATDLFLGNTVTRENRVWLMNGVVQASDLGLNPATPSSAAQEFAGVDDFDGDQRNDMAFWNTATDGNFTSPANAGDNNWKVLAGGDYGVGPGGAPGTVDVVWRNADSGRYVVWYLDLAGNRTSGTFTTPNQPAANPTDWTIVGPR